MGSIAFGVKNPDNSKITWNIQKCKTCKSVKNILGEKIFLCENKSCLWKLPRNRLGGGDVQTQTNATGRLLAYARRTWSKTHTHARTHTHCPWMPSAKWWLLIAFLCGNSKPAQHTGFWMNSVGNSQPIKFFWLDFYCYHSQFNFTESNKHQFKNRLRAVISRTCDVTQNLGHVCFCDVSEISRCRRIETNGRENVFLSDFLEIFLSRRDPLLSQMWRRMQESPEGSIFPCLRFNDAFHSYFEDGCSSSIASDVVSFSPLSKNISSFIQTAKVDQDLDLDVHWTRHFTNSCKGMSQNLDVDPDLILQIPLVCRWFIPEKHGKKCSLKWEF